MDARGSTTSGTGPRVSQTGAEVACGSMMSAGAVGRRHSTVQLSEGFAQDILQGPPDEAARASELGVEPGRGSQMSVAVLAGVDSLDALPVSLAAPEAFVHADCVSRHSAGGRAQPEYAASPVAAVRISQLGAGVGQGSTTPPWAVDSWLSAMQHSESPSAAPETSVDAGRVSRYPIDGCAQPADAVAGHSSCPMCKGTGVTVFGPCNMCP